MEDIMDVSHITNKGRHMNTKKHNHSYKKMVTTFIIKIQSLTIKYSMY